MSSGLVDTKLAHVQDRRVGAVASSVLGIDVVLEAPFHLESPVFAQVYLISSAKSRIIPSGPRT